MTEKEAIAQYNEYLEGHIGNVQEALQLFKSLDIPFVVDNYDDNIKDYQFASQALTNIVQELSKQIEKE